MSSKSNLKRNLNIRNNYEGPVKLNQSQAKIKAKGQNISTPSPIIAQDTIKAKRKSKKQLRILEDSLQSNPNWSNDDMLRIAKITGLSKSQVYKWHWDQKHKVNSPPSKVYVIQLNNKQLDASKGQILLRSPDEIKKFQKLL